MLELLCYNLLLPDYLLQRLDFSNVLSDSGFGKSWPWSSLTCWPHFYIAVLKGRLCSWQPNNTVFLLVLESEEMGLWRGIEKPGQGLVASVSVGSVPLSSPCRTAVRFYFNPDRKDGKGSGWVWPLACCSVPHRTVNRLWAHACGVALVTGRHLKYTLNIRVWHSVGYGTTPETCSEHTCLA